MLHRHCNLQSIVEMDANACDISFDSDDLPLDFNIENDDARKTNNGKIQILNISFGSEESITFDEFTKKPNIQNNQALCQGPWPKVISTN